MTKCNNVQQFVFDCYFVIHEVRDSLYSDLTHPLHQYDILCFNQFFLSFKAK